jgi:hypothetical protein
MMPRVAFQSTLMLTDKDQRPEFCMLMLQIYVVSNSPEWLAGLTKADTAAMTRARKKRTRAMVTDGIQWI